MAIEEFGALPATGELYRRAAMGLVVGRSDTGETPATELLVRGVTVARGHLARYARVCGFRLNDELPLTYPHVVAFPLMLELMTRPEFPFVAAGLVHLGNAVEQERSLRAEETLSVTVRAENLRDHDRGRAIDVVTGVCTGDRMVWRERSTYLHLDRHRPAQRSTVDAPVEPPPSVVWRVGPEAAAAYAAVSGDRNPIHTSRIAARLFGFRRPIAHGLWSVARCLATLEGRVPARTSVDITFRAPMLLPATVGFATHPIAEGLSFSLRDAVTGRGYLHGTLTG